MTLTISLGDDGEWYGTEETRAEFRRFERTLDSALESAGAGEVDGHEIGNAEGVIWMYGPDADQLFAAIEPMLAQCPLPVKHALLRHGDVDDPATTRRRIVFTDT